MQKFFRLVAGALLPLYVVLVLFAGCDNSNNVFNRKEQAKKDAIKAAAAKKRKTAERLGQQQRALEAEALRGTNRDPNRGR